ncbi:MAG: pitrilysin family protein [bacterium]|nr:pitrilysin family protein [bacterium]
MKHTLILLLALAPLLVVAAQPTIYTLNNGMEVMLVESHTNPVIASVVVVRTGSRNETIELNGATHFLEHLLFNGTKMRTQKQLYDDMDFLGGYNNANTDYDHTNFMILVDKDKFEQGLSIQADMLFNSTLPPDKFEKEKKIVIEEIGKDEDSENYRVESFFEQVIFRGTPYQYPILGSRQSIGRLSRQQVLDYYHTYYVPNNMVTMIIGDFDTQEMIKLLDQTFGQTPPTPLPEHRWITLPPFQSDPQGETVYLKQGNATSHHLKLAFSAPTRRFPDYYAFVVMTRLLENYLNAETSAKPDLGITSIGVDHFVDVDLGLLTINMTVDGGQDYEAALKELKAEVQRFREKIPSADQMAAVVTSARADELFNAERPHYYGMMRSGDLAQEGPFFLANYLQRLSAVTPEEVRVAVENYLNPSWSLTAVYQAKGGETDSAATPQTSRTIKRQLANGMSVVVQENQDNDIFAAHFLFKHRSAYERTLGGKPGIVDFIHHLLEQGPVQMNADEFQAQMSKYGARLTFCDMPFIPYDDYYTTPDFSFIRVETLDENYTPVLKLVAQDLENPNFTPPALEPVRGQMMGLSKRESASVKKKGEALFASLIYGDSPLASSIVGKAEDVKGFDTAQLRQFYQNYFNPRNLILTVVTSNNADSVLAQIETVFAAWQAGSDLPPVGNSRPQVAPKRAEQAGGKEQSYLAMGYNFELKNPADRAPLAILNAIISDRMQFQLREKEGLAYTLGSAISFHSGWGVWEANIGTKPVNLQRAEEGITEQVKRAAKEKFSDRDVDKAKNAYLGRLSMRSLTRISQAYQMGLGELSGDQWNRAVCWREELGKVTASEVDRVARLYLKTDGLSVAIVR